MLLSLPRGAELHRLDLAEAGGREALRPLHLEAHRPAEAGARPRPHCGAAGQQLDALRLPRSCRQVSPPRRPRRVRLPRARRGPHTGGRRRAMGLQFSNRAGASRHWTLPGRACFQQPPAGHVAALRLVRRRAALALQQPGGSAKEWATLPVRPPGQRRGRGDGVGAVQPPVLQGLADVERKGLLRKDARAGRAAGASARRRARRLAAACPRRHRGGGAEQKQHDNPEERRWRGARRRRGGLREGRAAPHDHDDQADFDGLPAVIHCGRHHHDDPAADLHKHRHADAHDDHADDDDADDDELDDRGAAHDAVLHGDDTHRVRTRPREDAILFPDRHLRLRRVGGLHQRAPELEWPGADAG
mmetsp:Transcript_9816/g.28118  ORF Transcript_9816/g.28118 Transcript_9816/m.28118 type:complete len:360 (+) Transcript_9816:996-2075(+)